MTGMVSLVAAMDASGDPHTGNHKFLGIVIGTQDKINSIIRNMGHNRFHMSTIRNKEIRQDILFRISFDGNESAAFCIRIDKNNTVSKLIQQVRTRNRPWLKRRIHATFNRSTMHYVRQEIEGFLIKRNHSIQDVVFECDDDCMGIIKDSGLRYAAAGYAHDLADAVAWANNRNMEPKGVSSADHASAIREMSYRKL